MKCLRNMDNSTKAGWLQLSSFWLFIGLFVPSTLFFGSALSPIFCCIAAIIYSFFTFTKKTSFNNKMNLVIEGVMQSTVVTMCYIYIFGAAFTHVQRLIGGVDAAITVGMSVIPSSFILPGFFAIVSLFAVAIGSASGTIATFLPIALGFGGKMGINPALISGMVVSAAMLGDNLSVISDTTIAATQTTGSKMSDKFKANVFLVIPAFFLTIGVLIYINSLYAIDVSYAFACPTWLDMVRILPYFLIFILAFMGLNVVAVLVSGIFCGVGLGIVLGMFNFSHGTFLLLEGFSINTSIHEILVLVLLISGLAKIVEYNGGINYLLNRFSKRITGKASAEVHISLLIALICMATAINTLAILLTGPVAKQIADKYGISGKRTACLLDIVACATKGMLPYGHQLLLAGSIASIPTVSIIPYLHYQGFISLIVVASIGMTYFKEQREKSVV